MELQYYGANCLRLTSKQASIVLDDNLEELDSKSQTKSGDIVVYTGAHGSIEADAKIVIDQPGEYEVSGISILGLPARSHMDEDSGRSATMFKITCDDLRILVTGHIYPEISESQLEEIGIVDVLIIPVGGNGYTLDAEGALKIVKKIEPKIMIPVHFADKTLNYPVPQQELSKVIDALGLGAVQAQAKAKLKSSDLPENLELIILSRQ